jgi:pyridoxamine 5'-phosphate oxidase
MDPDPDDVLAQVFGSLSAATALPEPLPSDPMPTFHAWFEDAMDAAHTPNPNAMALATVDADGRPSSRIVLCKSVDAERGQVTFFTNYLSDKARAIEHCSLVSLLFHWDDACRQARLDGYAVRTSESESDAYFATRPRTSRIGAWASEQSRPIPSREALLVRLHAALRRFGPAESDGPVPRPPHWGGYLVWIDRVELWVGGAGRIHDRARWTRDLVHDARGGPIGAGAWTGTRLQP